MLLLNSLYRHQGSTFLRTVRIINFSFHSNVFGKCYSLTNCNPLPLFLTDSPSFCYRKITNMVHSSMCTRSLLCTKNHNELVNTFLHNRYSNITNAPPSKSDQTPEKKPSLLQKIKIMYKDYWYVLVPVHLVTSALWFSGFYYLGKSGVDISSIMEKVGASESLVQKFRQQSTMGYITIAWALYKISSPARYTVTLGGTTISINYLKKWGYIKPIPPRDKLKEIIHEKKDILKGKKENLKIRFRRGKKSIENNGKK